jgi:hypothetical protein
MKQGGINSSFPPDNIVYWEVFAAVYLGVHALSGKCMLAAVVSARPNVRLFRFGPAGCYQLDKNFFRDLLMSGEIQLESAVSPCEGSSFSIPISGVSTLSEAPTVFSPTCFDGNSLVTTENIWGLNSCDLSMNISSTVAVTF